MKTMFLAGLAAAIAISGQALAEPPWQVSPQGLGPIKIGMTVKEVEKVLGTKITLDDAASGNEEACATADLPGHNASALFVHRRLSSIELDYQSDVKTTQGIGIGATEAQERAKYPKVQARPDPYDDAPPAKRMFYWETENVAGVAFAINDQGRVKWISAGDQAIMLDEGCA